METDIGFYRWLDLSGVGLVTLEGLGDHGGSLTICSPTLVSLEGMGNVGGHLDLAYCTSLTSLEGMGDVGQSLNIEGCTGLTSLKGMGKIGDGRCYFMGCVNLDLDSFTPYFKRRKRLHISYDMGDPTRWEEQWKKLSQTSSLTIYFRKDGKYCEFKNLDQAIAFRKETERAS